MGYSRLCKVAPARSRVARTGVVMLETYEITCEALRYLKGQGNLIVDASALDDSEQWLLVEGACWFGDGLLGFLFARDTDGPARAEQVAGHYAEMAACGDSAYYCDLELWHVVPDVPETLTVDSPDGPYIPVVVTCDDANEVRAVWGFSDFEAFNDCIRLSALCKLAVAGLLVPVADASPEGIAAHIHAMGRVCALEVVRDGNR